MDMAVLRFAFEVYEYQERDWQAPPSLYNKVVHEMLVKDYIGALVTGFLDRHGDTLHNYDALTAPLKLLAKFLALWTDACGLDFSEDKGLTWEDKTEIQPLVVCWCEQKENGLPVVDLLLKSGYCPHIRLVQLFVQMLLLADDCSSLFREKLD
jgi:hypothetical protein